MKKKLLIICNSTNPDLVQYFLCKSKSVSSQDVVLFKNRDIELEGDNVYTSSYTKSAFFDKNVFLDLLRSFYLAFIVIFQRVGVVHFTTAHISNIFLSVLLKPFYIKQIFTIHDLIAHPGKKAAFINLYNKFVSNILADEIIAFSKKEINKQSKKEKFIYLPLSGFEQFIDKPKHGERTILFFGRIESYKGLSNLLELIKKVNNTTLQYSFIIAGKGHIPNIDEFKQYDNVEIINRFISDEEVTKLFTKATFTILPYDSATQSGVTILSYAYATPVIAYDVGALGEYIENEKNGFLVNYKDNDKIIQILQALDSNNIETLSYNVINEFNQKFSIDACKKQYNNFYTKRMENQ